MKIGCCGTPEEASYLAEAGFDFLECPVKELLPRESEERFESHIREHRVALERLPTYAFNSFIPGDLKVTGPDVDAGELERYVETALRRVSKLGGSIVVFGSGGARSVPDGFPREEAWLQIIDFLRTTDEIAGACGVTIVIEPLRRQESNILNTLEETVAMVKDVDRPAHVRALVDLYHMREEEEEYRFIGEAGALLTHVHVADSERLHPGTGDYDFRGFLEHLNGINYPGELSIECKWSDKPNEAGQALRFLKEVGFAD